MLEQFEKTGKEALEALKDVVTLEQFRRGGGDVIVRHLAIIGHAGLGPKGRIR